MLELGEYDEWKHSGVQPDPIIVRLNKSHIVEMKTLFQEFGENSTDKVTILNFYKVLVKVLTDVKPIDSRRLFAKVDETCCGLISWIDFVVAWEAIGERKTLSDEYVQSKFKCFNRNPSHVFQWVSKPDYITRMARYSSPDVSIADRVAGCYVAASRRGDLFWWSSDLKICKKRNITTDVKNIDVPYSTKSAITDMVCVPTGRLIIVSTFLKSVNFYNSDPDDFKVCARIVNFPSWIFALDFHSANATRKEDILICAEKRGAFTVLYIDPSYYEALSIRESCSPQLPPIKKLFYSRIESSQYKTLRLVRVVVQEPSMLTQVKYIPSSDSVAVCSPYFEDNHLAICHLATQAQTVIKDREGIFCFDILYSNDISIPCLITGGGHSLIKAWLPSNYKRPSFMLKGLAGPVVRLIADSQRYLIITICVDWKVEVWDFASKLCKQSINMWTGPVDMESPYTVFYDDFTRNLFIHGVKSVVYSPMSEGYNQTHLAGVRLVLFDHSFNYIITGGQESRITAWDVDSGRKMADIFPAHTSDSEEDNLLEILDMKLEPTGRQLATIFGDSTVKVWNIHTGICIVRIRLQCVVTCALFFTVERLYVAGEKQGITEINLTKLSTTILKGLKKTHKVVSMDSYRGGKAVISASYDGELILWKDNHPRHFSEDKGYVYINIKSNTKQGKTSTAGMKCLKKRSCRITEVMFLQNRPLSRNIAVLVTCGADSFIRFWSVTSSIKLMSRFRFDEGAFGGVTCIASDVGNRYLISGNETGHVCIWDIETYCNCDEQVDHEELIEKNVKRFPYLRLQRLLLARRGQDEKIPFIYSNMEQKVDSSGVLNKAPLLVSRFRAHFCSIMDVCFIDGRDYITTAGSDGYARLWHIHGYYIGSFGQGAQFHPILASFSLHGEKTFIPPEIRAVASTTTLKVLNKGRCPLWERCVSAIRTKRRRYGYLPNWAHYMFTEEELELRKELEERKQNAEHESSILGRQAAMEETYTPMELKSENKKYGRGFDFYGTLDIQFKEFNFGEQASKLVKERTDYVDTLSKHPRDAPFSIKNKTFLSDEQWATREKRIDDQLRELREAIDDAKVSIGFVEDVTPDVVVKKPRIPRKSLVKRICEDRGPVPPPPIHQKLQEFFKSSEQLSAEIQLCRDTKVNKDDFKYAKIAGLNPRSKAESKDLFQGFLNDMYLDLELECKATNV